VTEVMCECCHQDSKMRNERTELRALCKAIVSAHENHNFNEASCQLLLAYAYSYFPELRKRGEQ